MGVTLGQHTLLTYDACTRGFNKLDVNPARLLTDLDDTCDNCDTWAILAEPIQSVM